MWQHEDFIKMDAVTVVVTIEWKNVTNNGTRTTSRKAWPLGVCCLTKGYVIPG